MEKFAYQNDIKISLFKRLKFLFLYRYQKYSAFHDVLRDYKYLYQENQRVYLNGIVHSHRKTEKVFFWQLEVFDVCTTGDTAHIDMIFKWLPHTR